MVNKNREQDIKDIGLTPQHIYAILSILKNGNIARNFWTLIKFMLESFTPDEQIRIIQNLREKI